MTCGPSCARPPTALASPRLESSGLKRLARHDVDPKVPLLDAPPHRRPDVAVEVAEVPDQERLCPVVTEEVVCHAPRFPRGAIAVDAGHVVSDGVCGGPVMPDRAHRLRNVGSPPAP